MFIFCMMSNSSCETKQPISGPNESDFKEINVYNFPPNYSYIKIPTDDDRKEFRIKEITDKDSAKVWLQEYSNISKTTWRVLRTYPYSGKFNIFKVDYRCCHNTDRRAKGTGPSKHTGCKAKLEIRVERFRENAKRKNNDTHTHPCVVILCDKHNHPVGTASSLKYRDVAPEIKEKFISMFHSGYSPSSSLKQHKKDLMQEMGANYCEVETDKRVMPSYSQVSKLYNKVFSSIYKDTSENMMCDNLETNLAPNDDFTTDDESESAFAADIIENDFSEKDEDNEKAVVDQVENLFENMLSKIKDGISNNPSIFLPAAKKMVKNANLFMKTDTALLRTMCTFGLHSGVKRRTRNAKNILRQCHKTVNGVHPTPLARQKHSLTGKKRVFAERPHVINVKKSSSLTFHDYIQLP